MASGTIKATNEWFTPKSIGTLTSNNPITITITGTTRFILLVISSAAARTGLYVVNGTTGTCYVNPIGAGATAVTVDTSVSGEIKLTSISTANAYVYVIPISGAGDIST